MIVDGMHDSDAFSKNREHKIVFLILLLSTGLQIAILLMMPISISNDSYGYLNLARNTFAPSVSFERSVGYSFLLAVLGANVFDTSILVIYFQAVLAISIPILAYYTLRPLGIGYALCASALALAFLYPYHMATQILTELPFMFTLSLFAYFSSRYFFTRRLIFLFLAIGATFGLTFIRVSGSMQFASLFAGLIVLIAYERWQRGRFDIRLIIHAGLGVALFLVFNVTYGAITDRTAGKVLPHFVFNWVYRTGTNIHYGIVDPKNGPVTREMFEKLGDAVQLFPNGYKTLATVAAEPVQHIANTQTSFDAADAQLLMDDLINNNSHSLRSWWIEGVLMNAYGVRKTSELLGGTIREAFIANPETILRRAKTVYERFKNQLTKGIVPSPVLLPTAYFHQVPKPGTVTFDGSLQPKIFAEWLSGLNSQVGDNDLWRQADKLGGYPVTWKEASNIFAADKNYIALGHYLVLATMQIARPVWVLMLAGFIFAFWSRQPGFAIAVILAGVVPPVISVFTSETDSRHFVMSYPVQMIAAVVSLEGFLTLTRKLLRPILPSGTPLTYLGGEYIFDKIGSSSRRITVPLQGLRSAVIHGRFGRAVTRFRAILPTKFTLILLAILVLGLGTFGLFLLSDVDGRDTGGAINQPPERPTGKPLETVTLIAQGGEQRLFWSAAHGVQILADADLSPSSRSQDHELRVSEVEGGREHFVGASPVRLESKSIVRMSAEVVDHGNDSVLLYLIGQKSSAFQTFNLQSGELGQRGEFGKVSVMAPKITKLAEPGAYNISVQFLIEDSPGPATLRLQLVQGLSSIYPGQAGNRRMTVKETRVQVDHFEYAEGPPS